MGNKTISGYANETSIASTTEFLAEKSGGDYVALTWAVISAMAEIGKTRTAYSETEATALINSGKYLEMADSGNPSNATYNVTASSYPLLAAARPEWVNGANIEIPNLYNRTERIKGTDTGNAGTLLEDAMQRITGSFNKGYTNGGPMRAGYEVDGVFIVGDETTNLPTYAAGTGYELDFDSSQSISPNTAKTDDDETRGKSFIVRKFVRALI